MAVGFEFQTGIKIWSIPKDTEKSICSQTTYRGRLQAINQATGNRAETSYDTPSGQLAYFAKNTALHETKHANWKIVTDGNELEFVTTQISIGAEAADQEIAFPDTIRFQAQTLTNYVALLDDVRAAVNVQRKYEGVSAISTWICRRDSPALFNQYKPFLLQFVRMSLYDYRDSPIAGFAQITGGIRITRIRKLFRILAKSQQTARQSGKAFLGSRDANAYGRLLSKTVNDLTTDRIVDSNWKNYPALKDHKASAELRGLVTLVTMYVLKGADQNSKEINVVKNLFFIMSRTDFGQLFSMISEKEQQHYKNHPDDWVSFICKDMMTIVFGRPVNPNNRLIKQSVTDYKSLDTPAKIPVTRRDWLTAMAVRQKDLLSTGAYAKLGEGAANTDWWIDVHGEHRLRGTGELGDKTDQIVIGDLERSVPIFEFRGPGNANNTMQYTAWEPYMFSAYKFLATLNIHAKSEAIDEKSIWAG